MEITGEALTRKFATVLPHLDERQQRILAGAEARSIGWGGITLVARASGLSRSTVQDGVDEVDAGIEVTDRVRRPGGGRRALTEIDPTLLRA